MVEMKNAVINVDLIRQVVDSFPNGGNWKVFECRKVIREPNTLLATWKDLKPLEHTAGVYAILLPMMLFDRELTLPLHAPKGKPKIKFSFKLKPLPGDRYGVVYVGRSTKFGQRWHAHLSLGERIASAQVKYGLMDCKLIAGQRRALAYLRENGRVVYHVLNGPENCANRDIVELTLCARFKPPFNIKSER
ncbi:MAG: hypothetical protein ABSF10_12685 [Verrucomicrobiota bacterium]